jgi:hypothetical protein
VPLQRGDHQVGLWHVAVACGRVRAGAVG